MAQADADTVPPCRLLVAQAHADAGPGHFPWVDEPAGFPSLVAPVLR